MSIDAKKEIPVLPDESDYSEVRLGFYLHSEYPGLNYRSKRMGSTPVYRVPRYEQFGKGFHSEKLYDYVLIKPATGLYEECFPVYVLYSESIGSGD